MSCKPDRTGRVQITPKEMRFLIENITEFRIGQRQTVVARNACHLPSKCVRMWRAACRRGVRATMYRSAQRRAGALLAESSAAHPSSPSSLSRSVSTRTASATRRTAGSCPTAARPDIDCLFITFARVRRNAVDRRHCQQQEYDKLSRTPSLLASAGVVAIALVFRGRLPVQPGRQAPVRRPAQQL